MAVLDLGQVVERRVRGLEGAGQAHEAPDQRQVFGIDGRSVAHGLSLVVGFFDRPTSAGLGTRRR